MLRGVLKDSFGRVHTYLRIAVTERCNMRCRYCMPEEGITLTPNEQLASAEEMLRIARICAGLGVTKVRLTGGEPLVRPDIESICASLRAIPQISKLAITTNGVLLPQKIEKLRSAGVTGLNVSLDSLQESRYCYITRRKGLAQVLQSLQIAEALKFDVKVNCVVVRGVNSDELFDIANLARDRSFEVRFIEFMPFDGNKWSYNGVVPFMEMMDVIEREAGGSRLVPLETEEGTVAKLFRLQGWKGTIGFITPVTQGFCSTCNRIRLTADGKLKVCLFGEETPLLDTIRAGAGDDEVSEVIRRAVSRKSFSFGGKASIAQMANITNRPMIKIGG